MKTIQPASRPFEFYFPEKDTLVRVEETEGSVVIRATRDSFSLMRKASFIRELAAEGFIADGYQWFATAESGSFLGVKWLIDLSWLTLPAAALARTRRFMHRLLCGSCLVWLGLMVALFQSWLGGGSSMSARPSRPSASLIANTHSGPSRVNAGTGGISWLRVAP